MTANVRVLHHTTLIERMHTSKAWGGRQVLGPGLRRLLASQRDAGARPVHSVSSARQAAAAPPRSRTCAGAAAQGNFDHGTCR